MATEDEFAALTGGYRRELLAHCYRMLGSTHDAEDVVQETYLRAWRSFDGFEGRSSVRTWLHRIATNTCLSAFEGRAGRERRVLPSGLSAPHSDAFADFGDKRWDMPWLEPFPDGPADPASQIVQRESTRLALVAALQTLPPKQRAALLLHDVLGWKASEAAELLGLSTTAVNSALQRARAEIAEVSPTEDAIDPDAVAEKVVERYAQAFDRADAPALADLLREDVRLQMPPFPLWLRGRQPVVDLFTKRLFSGLERRSLMTSANGCPAIATYVREHGEPLRPRAIQVVEVSGGAISHICSFLDPEDFALFGLPAELP